MEYQEKTKIKIWDHPYQKSDWLRAVGLIFLVIGIITAFLLVANVPATASYSSMDINQSSSFSRSDLPGNQNNLSTSIDCSDNPFGIVHDLYLEREVFVGATSTFGFNPNLTAEFLDQGTSNNLIEKWLYYEDNDPNGFGVVEHASAAADLDGDGNSEFIQTFINSNDEWYLAHYLIPLPEPLDIPPPTYYQLSTSPYGPISATSGDIFGTTSLQKQVVVAGVDQDSGKINILVWDGSTTSNPLQAQASWSSTLGGRQFSSLLDVAVGNFTGNVQDDIALLIKQNDDDMELVVLEYDPTHSSGSGDDVEFHLKPVDNVEFNPAIPSSIRVVAGRLNGDFRDDILVVFNDINADDQSIHVNAYELDPVNRSLEHLSDFNENIVYISGVFTMAAGMGEIDGDFTREEIVIGYPDDNGINLKIFGAQGLTTPSPSLATLYNWFSPWVSPGGRSQAEYLSLAVGDLNNDGPGEIVAAFDDGRGLEVIYLDQTNLSSNTLTTTIDLDPADLNTPTVIVLGDWNNDSVRAVYSGDPADCRVIKEDNLNSVVYRPPIWQNIQQPVDLFSTGHVGSTSETEISVERKLGYERSTVTSGYVGVGVEASYGLASFEASAKFTMAQEYSQGSAQGTEQSSSIADSVQHSAGWNFALVDETTYNCYSYDVIQNGVPITETTTLRSCELVDTVAKPTTLAVRDASAAVLETSANKALEWVPTTRDWASLALFCAGCTNQSSTAGAGTAEKSVDGILSGELISMTSTTVEDYPWLEIDLGQTEDINRIRIWNREDPKSCTAGSCPAHLSDFYIFISDNPFSPTDTPNDLLTDPSVYNYSLSTISKPLSTTLGTDFPAGRVTTFLTLTPTITGTIQPIQGQYVRIQINRTNAQLQLAEVQIFGPDHVEPNRYPLDVRSGSEEYFEVLLFDSYTNQNRWVQVRGELLWNGLNNTQEHVEIPVGGGGESVTEWSRLSKNTQTEFTSSTIAEKKSVGYEFDLSGGATVLAQAGFGMEFSTGIYTETTHSTSWSNGFELGGWVKGFPQGSPGATILWYPQCEYTIRPYYYVLTEESSFGYKSSHPVLDYVVTSDLNRLEDLTPCLLGHIYNTTSTASNDEATGTAAGSILIYALLNDAGTENLRIVSVDDPPNGSATFSKRIINYDPDPGFIGEDTFNYIISDGITSSTGKVTVTVNEILLFLPSVIR